MNTGSAGAVFFLGNRAHYQVLEQPESRRDDLENGNTSTETIPDMYQETHHYWEVERPRKHSYCGNTEQENGNEHYYGYSKDKNTTVDNKGPIHQREEMSPAQLNKIDAVSPSQTKSSKSSIISYLLSLLKPKKRPDYTNAQYLQQLEKMLTTCTYRDSCRCFECQSRYFECDETDDASSEDDEFISCYISQLLRAQNSIKAAPPPQHDDEEEVFIDRRPDDKKSTDCLIESREKVSISSEEAVIGQDNTLQLEVTAGTPILMSYLLNHPVTCSIQ